jgi:hypothetical protein
VHKAWKIGSSVASVELVVVVEPFVVVPAGVGTTLRYVLLRKLWSTSWVAVAIDHHYPMHQNHWGYSMPV